MDQQFVPFPPPALLEGMMYASALAAQETMRADYLAAAAAAFEQRLVATTAHAAALEAQMASTPPCDCSKCFTAFCKTGSPIAGSRTSCAHVCSRVEQPGSQERYKEQIDALQKKVVEVVSSMDYPEDKKNRIIAFLAPPRVVLDPFQYHIPEYCRLKMAELDTWANKLSWGLAKHSLPEITADLIRSVLASKGHLVGLAPKPAKNKSVKPKQGGGGGSGRA